MKGHEAVLTFPDTMPDAMRVEFGTIPTLEPWRVRLVSQPTEVQADAKYRISFRIRADKPREVIFTVREAKKPSANLGLYGRIPVTEEWQSVTREFTAKADASNALFSFDLGGSDVPVEVADVLFATVQSRAPITKNNPVTDADRRSTPPRDEWVPRTQINPMPNRDMMALTDRSSSARDLW